MGYVSIVLLDTAARLEVLSVFNAHSDKCQCLEVNVLIVVKLVKPGLIYSNNVQHVLLIPSLKLAIPHALGVNLTLLLRKKALHAGR